MIRLMITFVSRVCKIQCYVKKVYNFYDQFYVSVIMHQVRNYLQVHILLFHYVSIVMSNNPLSLIQVCCWFSCMIFFCHFLFTFFKNFSGLHCEKIKKEFQKLFWKHSLKLIIKCNLKIVDFLDVTLNLTDSTYKPYHKANDEICYIHKESNHPPSIKKQLSISIETRLSKLSSDKKVFNESISIYQEAFDKSGCNHQLTFLKSSTNDT